MGMLGTTKTRGWKPAIFRNQPVQEFYSHLQALLLRELAADNSLRHLFARPVTASQRFAGAEEVSWMTELNGEARAFPDLTPQEKEEVGIKLSSALDRMRAYSVDNCSATGPTKDYADFIRAVAVPPDLRNVLVIEGNPIIIHWGFVQEGVSAAGAAEFAGWQSFLTQIHGPAVTSPASPGKTNEPFSGPLPHDTEIISKQKIEQRQTSEIIETGKPLSKAEEQPATIEDSKTREPSEQSVDPEKHPPSYQWVKWLALILAIIILLLLIPYCGRFSAQPSSRQASQITGGSTGGVPSAGAPGAGQSAPDGVTPTDAPGAGQGAPDGVTLAGAPGAGQGAPDGVTPAGVTPTDAPGAGQGAPDGVTPAGAPGAGKSTCDEAHPTAQSVDKPKEIHDDKSGDAYIQVSGFQSYTLVAHEEGQNITWSVVADPESGPDLCRIEGSPDGKTGHGPSIKLNFSPSGQMSRKVLVTAKNQAGESTVFRFLVKP